MERGRDGGREGGKEGRHTWGSIGRGTTVTREGLRLLNSGGGPEVSQLDLKVRGLALEEEVFRLRGREGGRESVSE